MRRRPADVTRSYQTTDTLARCAAGPHATRATARRRNGLRPVVTRSCSTAIWERARLRGSDLAGGLRSAASGPPGRVDGREAVERIDRPTTCAISKLMQKDGEMTEPGVALTGARDSINVRVDGTELVLTWEPYALAELHEPMEFARIDPASGVARVFPKLRSASGFSPQFDLVSELRVPVNLPVALGARGEPRRT